MTTKVSALGSAWSISNLRIPNRIVMAPMSTNRADQYGHVTPHLISYLKRRALGGCGMIIVESATVDASMGSCGRNLRLDSEEYISGCRNLVCELHTFCTVVVAQLWHAGPRAYVQTGLPLSPLGTTLRLPIARAMEISEIETVVRHFIDAGDRAARAGFDAVEIHAAHGYLLHHFIDRITNWRQDAYGGSVEGRYRILTEIRTGLRSKHPHLPAILRLSLRSDDDFPTIAKVIQEAGFDAVDVRTGFSSMPRIDAETPVPEGYTLHIARKLRPHLNLPLLTGGRILTPEQAERAVLNDGLDAIVLGRALLADPDWARKALADQAIIPCLYDCEPSCYSRFKEGEFLHCVYYGRQE